MAITLQPVFDKKDLPPPPTPEEAQRQHDALSRQAYLGGLAQDREFAAHVLDGWLAEQEAEALARMGSCPAAELVDTRARWQAVKDLRQGLRDQLDAAKTAAAAVNTPPPP